MANESVDVTCLHVKVCLTGSLPVLGQVTDIIQCDPNVIQTKRGSYKMCLELDESVPKSLLFHPLEPLVWLHYPRPSAFGAPTLEEGGRICRFEFRNEGLQDQGRFEFLLRLAEEPSRGGRVYLSRDPTIYNKPDLAPLKGLEARFAAGWRSLVARAGGRTRAGRTSGLPALR
jgi:hypothetical protein